MGGRRYDIDWLRILIMLAVFLFHCARFFGGGSWHLNNDETSMFATVFIGWLDMWFMPMFFLLSGVGSWYALSSKSRGQYLSDRCKRLLVPLYTVGLFLLLPIQFYFEISSNSGYGGTFWDALPRYFGNLGHFSLGWPGGIVQVPFSGHLWFLQFLFLASVAALPLARYLESEKGLRWIEAQAGLFSRRGGILRLMVPIILIRVGSRWLFHGEHSWADFLEFMVFLAFGYLSAADRRFAERIAQSRWIAFMLGIACSAGEFIFVLRLGYAYPSGEPFSITYVVFESMMAIGRVSWIVCVLGFAARHLNFKNSVLSYGNEAVLPFYILHQTVILCLGWFVIRLDAGISLKYLVIAASSLLAIMLLYELFIRRVAALRFLFGMKTEKS